MVSRVLVAEDSRTQAGALQAHLEAGGYTVAVARDGEEALARLRSDPFDLLLSDIVMPGIDGYELCRQVKADPDLGRLPVVLLTSLADPMEVVRALEAGADNFLRKPYDPEQLITRIRTTLVQRDLRATGSLQVGFELFFLGRRFSITAERQQIFDLLVSTFEDLVKTNRDLHRREEELAAAQRALEDQLLAVGVERARLLGVLTALPEAMVIFDGQGMVSEVSEASEHLLGIPATAAIGRRVHDICRLVDRHGQRVALVSEVRAGLAADDTTVIGSGFDTYLERAASGPVPVVLHAATVRSASGGAGDVVVVLREIGGLAYHDPVTRLPNHTLFADRLHQAIERSAAHGRMAALLVIKLDRLSVVDETVGQSASDQVLAKVAARLAELLASPELGALADSPSGGFLGTDTFGVALPGVVNEVDAVRAGGLISERLSGRYQVADVEVTVTTSCGVALTAVAGPVADLLRAARAAAAAAESKGGACLELFDPTTRVRTAAWLRHESALRRAIGAGQLRLHYQPEVDLRTGRPVGAEALVRWQDPERGLLGPVDFIPLAEETGLIVPIGRWVIAEACRQAARWRQTLPGGEDFTIGVNLSARQLGDSGLVDLVAEVLADTGLVANALLLEITESAVMRDPDAAAVILGRLRALGVRFGLDDFGTGYSSLLYLRALPVDLLKVDRTFVARMCTEAGDAAIVHTTVQLAHALGLQAVAEGVETEAQRVHLASLGCDLAQGYLWSRGVESADFAAWWGAVSLFGRPGPDGRSGTPIGAAD
ncbi:MAG TPA: EAL domain-containing protein [Verrucomicrobiae bacterium]|nr:EAL domain-containing protein [Verrucomicrobiae bacterium]